MVIAGVIVEYNPFHNGHIHHLNETKRLTDADLVIGVISGFFNQRGTISIIDKKTKTQIALKYGVDLLIELPPYYVLSNADIFAKGAIKILDLCGVDYVCFGSETNNLKELKEISELNINPNHLKEIMKAGHSFPKSYGLLCGNFEANDLLAIAYLKALKKTKIKALSIQRTNSYHSLDIKKIASASAIRNAIKNKKDYKEATPLRIKKPLFNDCYFNYLKTTLLTSEPKKLKEYYLVEEGIENHLIKTIKKSSNYDDFILKATTRRYTKARIERTIIHILAQNTKKQIKELEPLDFIRVLGFNKKGQKYLKHLKDTINVCVNFSNIPYNHRQMFYKNAILYSYNLNQKESENILKQEIGSPIINKKG